MFGVYREALLNHSNLLFLISLNVCHSFYFAFPLILPLLHLLSRILELQPLLNLIFFQKYFIPSFSSFFEPEVPLNIQNCLSTQLCLYGKSFEKKESIFFVGVQFIEPFGKFHGDQMNQGESKEERDSDHNTPVESLGDYISIADSD